MFTGIVQSVGTVTSIEDGGATARLTISSAGLGDDLVHGESIAVNGVCLTVATLYTDTWAADVMRITLETSMLGDLTEGSRSTLNAPCSLPGGLEATSCRGTSMEWPRWSRA
ncbi:MAG TPA: riboflavin synthase, partial [Demequina sp.]|nr:riboflavin synthase [Demequina sp.]